MHIFVKKKFISFGDYKVKCALGKRGIGIKKKEGDNITPKGSYKIEYILYRRDKIKNFKTPFKKISINRKMGWCNDSRSIKYNKLITLPFRFTFEKLFRKDRIYDLILVLNFNMRPTLKNKGSAIFIHIAKRNYKKTEGCIAIKKNDILKVIKYLKKNTKIIIN
tara:strand:- start:419 stop:910 length:492 start_codon:yes stop_codon:yes gene_type:complete